MTPPLIDAHNRQLNYLRLSITDRCNQQCIYCRPKDQIPKLTHHDILTYEEIIRLVTIGVNMGIRKVRITGGEPLIRKDVGRLLTALTNIRQLQDVTLTTNAVLLDAHLATIQTAGIQRLNISLDSLRPEKYHSITGIDCFQKVWTNLIKAHEKGFTPIKINMVVLKGINDDEIIDFARLSQIYPFHIRFIEYMPMGSPPITTIHQILTPEIKSHLATLGALTPVTRQSMDGPAQRYRLPNAKGEIGFISAVSHHFCDQCNRLRLTASGQLRSCLLSDRQHDLRTALRNGCSDQTIAQLIRQAVQQKQHIHTLATRGVDSNMASIGG